MRQAVEDGHRREAPLKPVFKVVVRGDTKRSSKHVIDAATGRRVSPDEYLELQKRRGVQNENHASRWATTNAGLGMMGSPKGLTRTATKWTRKAQRESGARLATRGAKVPRPKYANTYSPTERNSERRTRFLVKYDSRHKFGDFKEQVKRKTYRDAPGYPTTSIKRHVRDYEQKVSNTLKDLEKDRYVNLIEKGHFREARPHEPPPVKFSELPKPPVRLWAEYDQLNAWDCLVSVEAAPNQGEQMSTRHDPNKYRAEADKAANCGRRSLI